MDRNKFKDHLRKRDEETLDERCERREELGTTASGGLPNLLWEYLREADDLYIRGHFVAANLLCGTIIEIILADQLRSAGRLTQGELEQFKLNQMAILCHRLGIISQLEKQHIDELRRLRNALVHANAGKLSKMGKKHYPSLDSDVSVSFFLTSFLGEGAQREARSHIRVVRNLSLRLYGLQEGQ
ncbi:MAG: hypothetical protein V3U31_03260 [Dehalococcoidia bacterium]